MSLFSSYEFLNTFCINFRSRAEPAHLHAEAMKFTEWFYWAT